MSQGSTSRPLSDHDRTAYLAEISIEICALAAERFRVLGGLLVLGAMVQATVQVDAGPLPAAWILGAGGIVLILFAGWLGGGPHSYWYRPAATYAAVTLLYQISIHLFQGDQVWNTGSCLLIFGSAFCLRTSSDLWRITYPLALVSLITVVPWGAPDDKIIPAVFFVFASAGAAYLGTRFLENARLSGFTSRRALNELATRDKLTGLPNRRFFEDCLSAEMGHYLRYGRDFSIAILDADDFKRINDTFGHDIGDAALVHVAGVLAQATREGDVLARWGGEEFAILFRTATAEEAAPAAERIRKALEAEPFTMPGINETITASIGIAGVQTGDLIESLAMRADQALYRAKSGGKNRVELFGRAHSTGNSGAAD